VLVPTNSKTAIIYFGEMLVASLLAIVLLFPDWLQPVRHAYCINLTLPYWFYVLGASSVRPGARALPGSMRRAIKAGWLTSRPNNAISLHPI
jgi:hypothetical protein